MTSKRLKLILTIFVSISSLAANAMALRPSAFKRSYNREAVKAKLTISESMLHKAVQDQFPDPKASLFDQVVQTVFLARGYQVYSSRIFSEHGWRGEVFLAKKIETGEFVAIKIADPYGDTMVPEMVHQYCLAMDSAISFWLERGMLGYEKWNFPALVQLFEAGAIPKSELLDSLESLPRKPEYQYDFLIERLQWDYHYQIMEFFDDGENLEERLREGYFEDKDLGKLIESLADFLYRLDDMHGKGLAHAELLPKNLMVDENLSFKACDLDPISHVDAPGSTEDRQYLAWQKDQVYIRSTIERVLYQRCKDEFGVREFFVKWNREYISENKGRLREFADALLVFKASLDKETEFGVGALRRMQLLDSSALRPIAHKLSDRLDGEDLKKANAIAREVFDSYKSSLTSMACNGMLREVRFLAPAFDYNIYFLLAQDNFENAGFNPGAFACIFRKHYSVLTDKARLTFDFLMERMKLDEFHDIYWNAIMYFKTENGSHWYLTTKVEDQIVRKYDDLVFHERIPQIRNPLMRLEIMEALYRGLEFISEQEIQDLKKAMAEVNRWIKEGVDITETPEIFINSVYKLHAIAMDRTRESESGEDIIIVDGKSQYRKGAAESTGRPRAYPPGPYVKSLMEVMGERVCSDDFKGRNPIMQAAEMYITLLDIHPFPNGNERIIKLVMNYFLMRGHVIPLQIQPKNKDEFVRVVRFMKTDEEFATFLVDQLGRGNHFYHEQDYVTGETDGLKSSSSARADISFEFKMKFYGMHNRMLDRKFRLDIPSIFKADLSSDILVFQEIPDTQRIRVFPKEIASERGISGIEIGLDAEGRVLMPKEFRLMHVPYDVTLVGAGEYFEIWASHLNNDELSAIRSGVITADFSRDPDVADRFGKFIGLFEGIVTDKDRFSFPADFKSRLSEGKLILRSFSSGGKSFLRAYDAISWVKFVEENRPEDPKAVCEYYLNMYGNSYVVDVKGRASIMPVEFRHFLGAKVSSELVYIGCGEYCEIWLFDEFRSQKPQPFRAWQRGTIRGELNRHVAPNRFMGSFDLALDRKNRLQIPKFFERTLSEGSVILEKRQDGESHSLRGYTVPSWVDQAETAKPSALSRLGLYYRQVYGGAQFAKIDRKGMLTFSKPICQHLGVDASSGVRFIGAGRFFELWEPGKHQDHILGLEESRPHLKAKQDAISGFTREGVDRGISEKFVSRFTVAVEGNNCIVLPVTFENLLSSRSLVLMPAREGKRRFIRAFDAVYWPDYVEANKPADLVQQNRYYRWMYGEGQPIQLKRDNRLRAKAMLRDFAYIRPRAKAIVIGAGEYFEIWNRDLFLSIEREQADAIAAMGIFDSDSNTDEGDYLMRASDKGKFVVPKLIRERLNGPYYMLQPVFDGDKSFLRVFDAGYWIRQVEDNLPVEPSELDIYYRILYGSSNLESIDNYHRLYATRRLQMLVGMQTPGTVRIRGRSNGLEVHFPENSTRKVPVFRAIDARKGIDSAA